VEYDNRGRALAWLIGVACVALAAGCDGEDERASCGDGTPPGSKAVAHRPAAGALWGRSGQPVLYLVECPAEISGEKPHRSGPLVNWNSTELQTWTRERTGEGVRITSPDLGPEARGSSSLHLALTPGAAREVWITPLVMGLQSVSHQRLYRTFQVALPPDAAPSLRVDLRIDLDEAVRGNWDDEMLAGSLAQLEITLPGAQPDEIVLHEALLEGPGAIFQEAVAAVRPVEIEGVIRPAWYVNGGGTVRLAVSLPRMDVDLRWQEGNVRGATSNIVRVIDGAQVTELSRGRAGPAWRHRSGSLGPWRGRSVILEFSAEGGGVAVFGDPRIVPAESWPSPPAVIVYMIDTLRADRLGAWGSPVPRVSPVIDRLAAEGVKLSNAISSSPSTKPAIPTLMTGIWPTTHKVGAVSHSDRLPPSVRLVQERFRHAGWRTGSFTAHPLGSTLSALERGFGTSLPPRHWRDRIGPLGHPAADQLHDALAEWLDEEPDQPFFAYVHTLEVHEYYKPLYQNQDREGLTPYDIAVSDADKKLGELIEGLRSRGRLSRLLLVVLSDHGESWGDHGLQGHGSGLFQSQLHIPIIFWGPGLITSHEIDHPVGLPDLAPTLLDLAALPELPEADGRSLASYVLGDAEPVHEYVAAALLRYIWNPGAPQQFALVSRHRRKVIRTAGEFEFQLQFDLRADPHELRPIGRGDDRLSAALADWLRQQEKAAEEFRARHGSPVSAVLDLEDAERLRSLGYIE
jgi:arylsulfatase A-like enzyme